MFWFNRKLMEPPLRVFKLGSCPSLPAHAGSSRAFSDVGLPGGSLFGTGRYTSLRFSYSMRSAVLVQQVALGTALCGSGSTLDVRGTWPRARSHGLRFTCMLCAGLLPIQPSRSASRTQGRSVSLCPGMHATPWLQPSPTAHMYRTVRCHTHAYGAAPTLTPDPPQPLCGQQQRTAHPLKASLHSNFFSVPTESNPPKHVLPGQLQV